MYTGLKTVVINDLHAGSDLALKSPHAYNSDEDTISPMNAGQEILYDFHDGLAKEWREPDCLIINGDLLEGLQGTLVAGQAVTALCAGKAGKDYTRDGYL